MKIKRKKKKKEHVNEIKESGADNISRNKSGVGFNWVIKIELNAILRRAMIFSACHFKQDEMRICYDIKTRTYYRDCIINPILDGLLAL